MDVVELDGLYAELIPALRSGEAPSAELNAGIARILREQDGAAVGEVPDYVGDLPTAMGLMPLGTWFNWNHFGFQVVPNRPVGGGEWSNAVDYHAEDGHREGAPIAYEVMAYDSAGTRASLPRIVCQAVMMARRAAVRKERARREGRHYHVDTGQGPLVATPEGRLVEMGRESFLTADGRVVPYDPALHGTIRYEVLDG
jgi:hypothetical protein